jgi:hypothetical protein
MNPTFNYTSGGEDNPLLDAEMVSLSRQLDMLGAMDRDAAPRNLGTSVMNAVAAATDVNEIRARVSELGAIERSVADRRFEDRVFEATLGAFASVGDLPHLNLTDTDPRQHAASDRSRSVLGHRRLVGSRFVAIAAVLALGATAGLLTLAMRDSSSNNQLASAKPLGTLTSEQLAAQIDSDMDALLTAMQESTPTATESAATTDYSTEWLDDLSTSTGGAS